MQKKQTDRKSVIELEDHLPSESAGIDEMMQFYKWNFAEAATAQTKYEVQNPEQIAKGPIFRWQGAQELMELQKSYQSGDNGAILKALHICFSKQLPIPKWCSTAYLNKYRQVKFYQAKTWGDVFGNPHPSGTHLATKKQEIDYSFRVYDRIKQIKADDPSIPVDGWLFERVGKEFGIGGKTLTEEYYYKWKNYFKE